MIHDGLACCWCPAHRFPTRQALADHEACPARLAELATTPADPLAVLRQALVWAEDEGAFWALSSEAASLLSSGRLGPGKSIAGHAATLIGRAGSTLVRAEITGDGAMLSVLFDDGRMSNRMRVRLPAEFAMTAPRPPQLRDSRAMAERLEQAAAQGLETQQ